MAALNPVSLDLQQRTLSRSISFIGRGLHTGKHVRLSIQPAAVNSGYVFVRQDVSYPQSEVRARWYSVKDTRLCTTIGNYYGVTVATVEHVLAALYACGVDNAVLSLDGPEVPCMDGSAQPFVSMIRQAGFRYQGTERQVILIEKTTAVSEGATRVSLEPYPLPWVSMEIEFDNPTIGNQVLSMALDPSAFIDEMAAARTFGFDHQMETLKQLGFARGGTLNNAILVSKDGVINPEGLRFPDEFVRHKALDAIGDIALAGTPVYGRFCGYCSGHTLNNRLLYNLMENRDSWRYTSYSEAQRYWKSRELHPQAGIG